MTLNGQDSNALVHVKNIRLLEMKNDPNRKDGFEGNTKIGPALEVKVTNYLERCWIEVKIDSDPERWNSILDCDQQ